MNPFGPHVYIVSASAAPVEGNILFNVTLNTLFTVIWHQTYGKRPFKQREGKPAAATTWATRTLHVFVVPTSD